MTQNLTRTDLFPTQVFTCQQMSPGRQNAALLAAILAEREMDAEGREHSNYPRLGGWHSRNALHREVEFAQIAQQVRDAAASISAELGYAAGLRIDAMWAIVNAPGAANRAHVHPGSLWSGVYYVKAEANAGQIEFLDPRLANIMREPRYGTRPDACRTAVRYDPVPGLMILFPSWLYHAVHPNLSGEDRVIVSFNLSQA